MAKTEVLPPDAADAMPYALAAPASKALTAMSPEEIQTQLARITEFQQNLMKEGVDYGIIKGCKKPSLWQPGAEILARGMGLGAELHQFQRFALPPPPGAPAGPMHFGYMVSYRIKSLATGAVLYDGIGSCTTREAKYLSTIESRRVSPADLDNTILQMAGKRAYVSGVRHGTAASRIFTQDVEDLPPAYFDEDVRRGSDRTPRTMARPDLPKYDERGERLAKDSFSEELNGKPPETEEDVDAERERILKSVKACVKELKDAGVDLRRIFPEASSWLQFQGDLKKSTMAYLRDVLKRAEAAVYQAGCTTREEPEPEDPKQRSQVIRMLQTACSDLRKAGGFPKDHFGVQNDGDIPAALGLYNTQEIADKIQAMRDQAKQLKRAPR